MMKWLRARFQRKEQNCAGRSYLPKTEITNSKNICDIARCFIMSESINYKTIKLRICTYIRF